jgi:hypothetical protein
MQMVSPSNEIEAAGAIIERECHISRPLLLTVTFTDSSHSFTQPHQQPAAVKIFLPEYSTNSSELLDTASELPAHLLLPC